MNIKLSTHFADGYKSPSQKARRITEGWFKQNMYCPNCPSLRLEQTKDNTKVVDFVCTNCGAEFQVKAKGNKIGKKLRDAAYHPMMERILSNRSPHFAFLQYDPSNWKLNNLLLVPGHFFTPNIIEKCKPLSRTARRAGWIGCNILVNNIPPDGRLFVIKNNKAFAPKHVRGKWKQFSWLSKKDVSFRGWTADILQCVRSFGKREFTLQEVYEFEDELAAEHPENKNIRPKIRQQLQILRDHKVIRFLGSGRYISI